MLLAHWTERLSVSSSLYFPSLKNGSFIFHFALRELFNCFTSVLLIVILASSCFPCCLQAHENRAILYISFRDLISLLAYLQQACDTHHCCIFLERKNSKDSNGGITLVMRTKPLPEQRNLLETSGMSSVTTGICTFW